MKSKVLIFGSHKQKLLYKVSDICFLILVPSQRAEKENKTTQMILSVSYTGAAFCCFLPNAQDQDKEQNNTPWSFDCFRFLVLGRSAKHKGIH